MSFLNFFLNMSNVQSFLEVQNVETDTAKDGRQFQKVTFRLIKFLGDRQVKTTQTRSRNLWEANELPDGRVIKADALFGECTTGMLVDGTIMTYNTTPYKIGENTVNTWTGVVFNGENGITVANNQLKNQGACVVDEHGQPTANVKVSTPKIQSAVAAGAEDDSEF